MLNMTKAGSWKPHRLVCKCKEIQKKWQITFGHKLPECEGHIFFASGDYCGPQAQVFQHSSKCIPCPTPKHSAKLMVGILDKFKFDLNGVKYKLSEATKHNMVDMTFNNGTTNDKRALHNFVSQDDVDEVKHLLQHLVFSPIDKNGAKMVGNCPTQYMADLANMMGPQTAGYKEMHLRVANKHLLRKLKEKMKTATLVDLRNIYSEKEVLGAGFKHYHAVGR